MDLYINIKVAREEDLKSQIGNKYFDLVDFQKVDAFRKPWYLFDNVFKVFNNMFKVFNLFQYLPTLHWLKTFATGR